MSRNILSIDIRSTTISAVLVNTGLKTNVIQNCLFVPLTADSKDADALTKGIDTVLKHFDTSGTNIITAIPSDQAYYRTLKVPFDDEKKIRQILPFEIESFLPVNVDDLIIDFQKGRQNEHTDLLITAIERQSLQYYLEIFNSLNKQPQLVVPGPIPTLLNILNIDEAMTDQAILLDVDATKGSVYAVRNGTIALVRNLSADLQSDADVEKLALQVRQTLTAYSDTTATEFTPRLAYLCGPAMREETCRQSLSNALPWPVEFIDLRKLSPKVEISSAVETYNPWLMDNALALALLEAEGRECPSFHRSSSPLRDFWTSYRSYIFGPALLLAIAIFMGLGGVVLENFMLQRQVNQINDQMKAVFASAFPDTQPLDDTLSHMKSKLKQMQAGSSGMVQGATKVKILDILHEISGKIPKKVDVRFTRMVVGADTVTISGKAAAFNIVDDVKSRLEQCKWFKQVEIASANMDKSGEAVSFKFTINL